MSRQSEKSNAKPQGTPVPAQIREAQRKSKGKDEVFTDDEVKVLEQELIDTYIRSGDRPFKILFKMYKKYTKE